VLAESALALVVWAAGAAVFYRDMWRRGGSRVMGNDGDNRLVAYLCEHWFQVLHGTASWRNPSFYYPVKGLLGWSDAFFLYQVFYAPFRELGCDPVVALQLTVIVLGLIGFVSFYWLARTAFRAPWFLALAGALVFCFSNTLYLHVGSPQQAGLFLLPPVILLAIRAWRGCGPPGRGAPLVAASAGLLYGLLFFTTYYVAVFSLLAGAIAAVWYLLIRPRGTRGAGLDRGSLRPAAVTAGAGLIAFLIGFSPVPFTYLPAHSAIGRVPESTLLLYSLKYPAVVTASHTNLVWGGLLTHLRSAAASAAYEAEYGFTPILLAALLLASVLLLRDRLRARRAPLVPRPERGHRALEGGAEFSPRAVATLVLALTALSVLVIPVRILGRPPWLVLWHFPGFDAIRAIGRIQVVAEAAALLALVGAASEWLERRAHRLHRGVAGRVVLALMVVAILVEQVNTAPEAQIFPAAQDRLLASATAPPAGCRYFYVIDSTSPGLPFYESQIDAMLISQKLGVPTLNGYTGYDPKGWQLDPIGAPGYLATVRSWEEQEHTGPGACQLDLGHMSWTRENSP
jgi:hypothetical protein